MSGLAMAVLLACAAVAGAGPARGPEVWLFPAPWPGNGRGLRQMVAREDEWPRARSLADGIGYWPWLLDAWSSDDDLRAFFAAVKRWDLRLGLEVPVVKAPAWGGDARPLDARRAFEQWRAQWERFRRCGMGRVDAFSFDEPVYAARHVIPAQEPPGALPDAPDRPTAATPARERIAYAARETAAFVQTLRKEHPRARVGDIEPYPALTLAEIQEAVDAIQRECRRRGVRGLDFVRIDPDWSLMGAGGQGSWVEMKRLETWCRQRNLSFSIIVWAAQNPRLPEERRADNGTWLAGLLAQGEAMRRAGVRPDQIVIESWLHVPDEAVPESLPGTFTHSVVEYARAFGLRPRR